MDYEILVGKIVSWPNMDVEHTAISAGRGKVIELLESPFMLVQTVPRNGDTEPPHMMVLPITMPGLHYYNNLAEERKWYAWVCNDPEPVVKLVEGGK